MSEELVKAIQQQPLGRHPFQAIESTRCELYAMILVDPPETRWKKKEKERKKANQSATRTTILHFQM